MIAAFYYFLLSVSSTNIIPALIMFHRLDSKAANKIDHYGLYMLAALNFGQGQDGRIAIIMTVTCFIIAMFFSFILIDAAVFLMPLLMIFLTSLQYVFYRQVYLGVMENSPVKSKIFTVSSLLSFGNK